jgi:quinol monooxygenase YgiN
MFGLIVKFIASPGKRDELIQTLSAGFQNMAGCHSYILAEDPADENGVWATEIWESHESHQQAMAQPDIKAVIAEAKAHNLTKGREMRVVTKPIGGQGLFRDTAWRPEPVLIHSGGANA